MERLLMLVATHFIGDYPFQSEWMVRFKGTDFSVDLKDGSKKLVAKWYEVLFYHVAVYVFSMYVFMRLAGYHPTPQGLIVDGVVHFVADTLKCRGFVRWIWIDQLIHLGTRAFLWWIGWL